MTLPLADWQFWVVTAVAVGGLWSLVAPLLPARGRRRGSCGHCATGAAACTGKEIPARPAGGEGPRLRVLQGEDGG